MQKAERKRNEGSRTILVENRLQVCESNKSTSAGASRSVRKAFVAVLRTPIPETLAPVLFTSLSFAVHTHELGSMTPGHRFHEFCDFVVCRKLQPLIESVNRP